MKTKSFLLLFFLTSASLFAAVAYNGGSLTDARAARLERARLRSNKSQCLVLSLPANCTQVQARVINPDAMIYTDLSDYIERGILRGYADNLKQTDTADDMTQAQAAWNAANDAGKTVICNSVGLPNNCEIWPR